MIAQDIKIGELYGWKFELFSGDIRPFHLENITWSKLVRVIAIDIECNSYNPALIYKIKVSEVADNRYRYLPDFTFTVSPEQLMTIDEYMLDQY